MTKGAFGRARRCALRFRPCAHGSHEKRVAAVAADVTQVQGVSVAWGDHHARGALEYLALGAGHGALEGFVPGQVNVR